MIFVFSKDEEESVSPPQKKPKVEEESEPIKKRKMIEDFFSKAKPDTEKQSSAATGSSSGYVRTEGWTGFDLATQILSRLHGSIRGNPCYEAVLFRMSRIVISLIRECQKNNMFLYPRAYSIAPQTTANLRLVCEQSNRSCETDRKFPLQTVEAHF